MLTRSDLIMIERSDIDQLHDRFVQYPELINATSYREGSCTGLGYAASLGHFEVVATLIHLQSNVEARCHEESLTPLMLAVICSLQHEVNHNLCPAHLASEVPVHDDHAKAARIILTDGRASVSASDAKGRQAIHLAAMNGNLNILRDLLNKGADPNARDSYGWTPIFYAVQRDDHECIVQLARGGALVDAKDDMGYSPLMHAVHLGHIKSIRGLRRHHAKCAFDVLELIYDKLNEQSDPLEHKRLMKALGPHCMPTNYHDEL